jgi:heterodisulfide reductase subunit D
MVAEFKRLKALREMVYACGSSGECRVSYRPSAGRLGTCPVLEHVPGFAPYYARGKIAICRALLEGWLKPSEDLARVIYQCTLCGSCRETCHRSYTPSIEYFVCRQLDHVKVFEALRADLVDAGVAPMPRHKEFAEWCKKEHNPYFEKHEDRVKWIPQGKSLPRKGELLFFMGCTEPYRMPEQCQYFLHIMEAASVEVAIAHPDEWCCGSVFLRTGVRDLAEELAKHNVKAFKEVGAKRIVTDCAGCYRTLKIDYPEIVGDFPFEVLHSTELISDLIKKGNLKFKKEVKKKVAWHDPCHLGRHARVYDAPREVIRSIPGIEFVELKRNREKAWCCGAGGGVKSAFPDLALKVANDIFADAREVGAEYLVTQCPFCLHNFKDAEKAYSPSVKVQSLLELIIEALG